MYKLKKGSTWIPLFGVILLAIYECRDLENGMLDEEDPEY